MLSTEQQKLVEDSLWVVNTALKRQGLSHNDDLRQSAICYMCQCVERYNPDTNVKWTTYAYKNVSLYIKRINKKEMQHNSMFSDNGLNDAFDCTVEPQNYNDSVFMLERIKIVCSPLETRVLELKQQGYRCAEIGKMVNCSQDKVNCLMQSIKRKARAIEF